MTENKHNCLQGVHTAKITTQADMTNKLTYELTQQKVYSVRFVCNYDVWHIPKKPLLKFFDSKSINTAPTLYTIEEMQAPYCF